MSGNIHFMPAGMVYRVPFENDKSQTFSKSKNIKEKKPEALDQERTATSIIPSPVAKNPIPERGETKISPPKIICRTRNNESSSLHAVNEYCVFNTDMKAVRQTLTSCKPVQNELSDCKNWESPSTSKPNGNSCHPSVNHHLKQDSDLSDFDSCSRGSPIRDRSRNFASSSTPKPNNIRKPIEDNNGTAINHHPQNFHHHHSHASMEETNKTVNPSKEHFKHKSSSKLNPHKVNVENGSSNRDSPPIKHRNRNFFSSSTTKPNDIRSAKNSDGTSVNHHPQKEGRRYWHLPLDASSSKLNGDCTKKRENNPSKKHFEHHSFKSNPHRINVGNSSDGWGLHATSSTLNGECTKPEENKTCVENRPYQMTTKVVPASMKLKEENKPTSPKFKGQLTTPEEKSIISDSAKQELNQHQARVENRPSDQMGTNGTKTTESSPKKNLICECDNCDSLFNCVTWRDNNTKFPETTNSLKKGSSLLKVQGANCNPTIKKICDKNIVIHGMIIPRKVESVKAVHFIRDIKKSLQTVCPSPTPIQQYMWPCIKIGLNAVMIGAPKSGKTFAYLPPICSFALEIYEEMSSYEGPVIVIVCPDKEKCQELQRMVECLIRDCQEPPIVEVLSSHTKKTNSDILVTEPSTLETCLKTESVKLQRVGHVVLENADVLLKNESKFMASFFKILNEIQINRPHHKNIQVIACSEKWSKDLQVLMSNLHVPPVVCFEDFFEAALYAGLRIEKKKINPNHRLHFLMDTLQQRYTTNRSIVFCESGQIDHISEHLRLLKGIECIAITDKLTKDEIYDNGNMWSTLKPGHFRVLLCSDAPLGKTSVVLNADLIIHLSFPPSWDTFRKRFRCMQQNFNSFLESESAVKDIYSVLVDDVEESKSIFTDFYGVLSRSRLVYFHL